MSKFAPKKTENNSSNNNSGNNSDDNSDFRKKHPSQKKIYISREKVLENFVKAQASTMAEIEERMEGKSGDELKMLQNTLEAVKNKMTNYLDLIDLEKAKKSQIQEQNNRVQQASKIDEKVAEKFVEKVINQVVANIKNAYEKLGFECDVDVTKNKENKISFESRPKMPAGFEGKDPFSLSPDQLKEAKELLSKPQANLKNNPPGHPVVGKWTGFLANQTSSQQTSQSRE